MAKVKMRYRGPGTRPADMSVDESEVESLSNTGLWSKITSKEDKEKVPDSGGVTEPEGTDNG